MSQDKHHHPLDSHMLLLRFPEETREELAALESPPKRRKSRWPRRLLVLGSFFALFLITSLLEIDVAQQAWRRQALEAGLQAIQQWKEQLRTLPPPKERPQYGLSQSILGLQKLNTLHQRLCTSSTSPPLRSPSTSATHSDTRPQVFSGQGLPSWLQTLLPQRYMMMLASAPKWLPHPLKQQWRTWRLPQAPPQQTRQAWCKNDFPQQQQKLERHILASQEVLLQKAKRALQNYGWCQQVWAVTFYTRSHRSALEKLHRSGCVARCQEAQNELCLSCLQSLSTKPSPTAPLSPSPLQSSPPSKTSEEVWRKYLKLIQEATQRRCIQTHERFSAQDGIFQLGWYYHYIKQVFESLSKLEQWGRCNERCKTLRSLWGFQLQWTTQPHPAQIYIQLWPQRWKAPTALQQLIERPQAVANGKSVWLPALRQDLLPQKDVPRNFFYFFRLYDTQNGKQAVVLVSPKPNTILKKSLTLHQLNLHNDGHQIVRYPSISSDGSFLAFATFRQLPGDPPLTFSPPHCPKRTQARWQSVLSLYRLSKEGIPGQAQHKAFSGHIHHLQLTQSERHYALRLTVRGAFGEEPNTLPPERPFALWELPLETETTQPFGAPTRATPSQDAPFYSLTHEGDALLALRLGCKNPPEQIQLEQQPRQRWSGPQALPEGKQLLHGAWWKPQRLALLLRNSQEPKQTSLWFPLLQGNGPVDHALEVRLQHPFTQIHAAPKGLFLSGGPWGSPLQWLGWKQKKPQTLLPTHPDARYLDPVLHTQSQRVFVIQQWKLSTHRRAYLFFSFPWRI